jgi:photosystem II stability/assembly factor-like uncharacterized protein
MRAVLLLIFSCSLWSADRWQMQYFFDQDNEELQFTAIAFCSSTRGVATGVLTSDGRTKPTSVVTADGGAHWTPTPTQEIGTALYFREETAGWMVTESGIWFTDECGRSWRRIYKQRGLTDVRFVSRERGWAIGARKTAIETRDGGKTWTPVKEVRELDMDVDRTTFYAIEFVTPKIGIMSAKSGRSRDGKVPLWLDPEPEKRRERPGLSVSLETHDGGETWSANKVSMFGRISRIRVAKDGRGLALVEFDDFFEFPSEIYRLDTKGAENRVLRKKDFAVTDILFSGKAYAAGFVTSGGVFRSPIPGKVRIASSQNLSDWTEAKVDYRAVANRVVLGSSGENVWAATDTGMILKRVVE